MEQKDEMAVNEAVETQDAVCVEPENEQVAADQVQETVAVPVEPVTPVATEVPTPVETEKKGNKKKTLIVIGAIAATVVIAAVILFVAVIQPNSIYKEAQAALEKKNYEECQELLDKIPNHKGTAALQKELNDHSVFEQAQVALEQKNYEVCQDLLDKIPDHEGTPALKRDLNIAIAKNYIEIGDLDLAESILATMLGDTRAQTLKEDIIYKRAVVAIAHEKYDEAQEYMDKIPNYKDSENLRAKLTYQSALQCIEQGNYEAGYEMMSSLGDYEDAVEQKEMMYYEALAFISLLEIQSTLKNPASMRVTDVGFYKSSSETTKDIDIVHKITASNSYGGNVGGYVYDVGVYEGLKTGENNPGMMDHSSYVDPDDQYEALEAALIQLIITYDEKIECSVDIARMNRLLENKVTFKIDLDFQSGETVDN